MNIPQLSYFEIWWIFVMGLAIIETAWYFIFMHDNLERIELDAQEEIEETSRPYILKRLRQCKAMEKYISER